MSCSQNGSITPVEPLWESQVYLPSIFLVFSVLFLLWCHVLFSLCGVSSKLTVYAAGSIFLLYSGPVLIIAFLAIAHLLISGEEKIPEYVISRNFPICALNFIIVFYIFYLICWGALFFWLGICWQEEEFQVSKLPAMDFSSACQWTIWGCFCYRVHWDCPLHSLCYLGSLQLYFEGPCFYLSFLSLIL